MIRGKKIFFLADSTVDLQFLYNYLKKFNNNKWIVYDHKVKKDLIKLGYKKKEILYLQEYEFLSKKNKLNIFLNKVYYYLKFRLLKKNILIDFIKLFDEKFKPDLWVTDTGYILSQVNVTGKKCTFMHTVCYKKHFLTDSILNYDKVFVPGNFHLNRILRFYKNKKIYLKDKLEIITSPKIIPFLHKKKTLKEKKIFTNKTKLNLSYKNILFAPTHDAFSFNRFLPNNFGDQFKCLKKLAIYVTNDLKCNFIVKFHHYHNQLNVHPIIKEIGKQKNVYIFKPGSYSNHSTSNQFLFNSDIVITDTSGVGPISAFLDKKIIFLEPDKPFDWSESDINSQLRPGFVCKTYPSLINALKKYNTSDNFKMNRKKFVKKIFYQTKNLDQDLHKKIRELF